MGCVFNDPIYMNEIPEIYRNLPTAKLVPDVVPCGKKAEILIVFQGAEEFIRSELHAWVESGEEFYDEKLVLSEVNPYVFSFNIKFPVPCRAKVRLGLDCQHLESLPLTIREDTAPSSMQMINVTHPFITMLDTVLQKKSSGALKREDKQLAKCLMNEIHSKDLQCLFDNYSKFFGEDKKHSSREMPTLLHLVAKYNLSEVCAALSEYRGFCSIAELLKDNPGFTDMAQQLGEYVEMSNKAMRVYNAASGIVTENNNSDRDDCYERYETCANTNRWREEDAISPREIEAGNDRIQAWRLKTKLRSNELLEGTQGQPLPPVPPRPPRNHPPRPPRQQTKLK